MKFDPMSYFGVINRYLFAELIPPFFMNLAFFLFVFLMHQILNITDMIVNYHISMAAFGWMLLYSMPTFLVYIIPMSVMMAVLLGFLRLSTDNEIVALKAAGISLYRLVTPVLAFAVLCAVLTAVMGIYGRPWGEKSYRKLAVQVVQSNFNLGLKERSFSDSFDGVMFYIGEVNLKNKKLTDIFIEDQREEGTSSTVVAPEGHIFPMEDKYIIILRLYNGMINRVNLDGRAAHTILFGTYDLSLDMKDAIAEAGNRKLEEREMEYSEILSFLHSRQKKDKLYYSILIEFHKKFSFSFACIALGILAIPLGVHSISSRRSAGLGIGLTAFLLYYLLLSVGLVLGERGTLPPLVGMWLPNLIMGGAGLYLFIMVANDKSILFLTVIQAGIEKMVSFFKRRLPQSF